MEKRPRTLRLCVTTAAVTIAGMVCLSYFACGVEPGLLPQAETPSNEGGSAVLPAPSSTHTGAAEVRRPAPSGPVTDAWERTERDWDRKEIPALADATGAEIAALEREAVAVDEPPQEGLDQLWREADLLPDQRVLDELRRESEIEPDREELDRLWREASIEPTPEQLRELRRQSEVP